MAKYEITQEQLKSFARYDISYYDFFPAETSCDVNDLKFKSRYTLRLEDLTAALKKIKDSDLTLSEVYEDWFSYISGQAGETFFRMFRMDDMVEDMPSMDGLLPSYDEMVPEYESAYVLALINELNDSFENPDNILPARSLLDLDDYLSTEDCFLYNNIHRDKKYPDYIMRNYITSTALKFENNDTNPQEEETYRSFCDKLSEKGNVAALEIKAKLLSIGTRVYPRNPKEAVEIYEYIFEGYHSPHIAEAMAELYIELHRYKKAFEYLSYMNFSDESGMAKTYNHILADLYDKGHGTFKDPETAFRLYVEAYSANRNQFTKGRNAQFADATYALACFIKEKVYDEEGKTDVLSLLLEAQYAYSIPRLNKPGKDLSERIQQCDEDIKECMVKPFRKCAQYFLLDNENDLDAILNRNGVLCAFEELNQKGEATILIQQALDEPNGPFMLATLTDYGFVFRSKKLYLHIKDAVIDIADKTRFDEAEVNGNKIQLYLNNALVGSLEGEIRLWRKDILANQ